MKTKGDRMARAAAPLLAGCGALLITVVSACTDAPPAVGTASESPRQLVVLASPGADAAPAPADEAAGLAVEVAHLLSRSPRLVVREVSGPTLTGGSPFADLAERLSVEYVLRLTFAGEAGERLASYRLEGFAGEIAAGSLRVNADSIGSLPRRIAQEVSVALGEEEGEGLPSAGAAPSADAYGELLLALGRAYTLELGPRERIAAFKPLAERLNGYAPAVTELGKAYLDLAGELGGTGPYYDLAEQTLSRAFELDPGFPASRRVLASYFAKVGRSEESLALALDGIALQPAFSGYHDQVGYVLRYAGLLDESMESYQRSQELDGSLENLVGSQDQITKSLIYLGRYDAALTSHEHMESFVARLGRAPDEKEWFYRGVIHLYAGRLDLALEAFRRGEELDPASVWTTFGRAYAGIARVNSTSVVRVLDELERVGVVDGERHYRLVHFATFLGQTERALEHLKVTIESGFFAAPYLASDPLTASLRATPEFQGLLRRAEERRAGFQRMVGRRGKMRTRPAGL